MIIQTTSRFDKDYQSLPKKIQLKTDSILEIFLNNPYHPSLHTKKMKGVKNIFEGRVTINYRFTFQISGEIYILRRIGTHDILRTP